MAFYRKENVHLIEIDDHYALIDARDSMVHIVNRSGAHAWTQLEGAEESFLNTLWDLNVLVKEPTENAPDEPVPPGVDPPAVISSRQIQVAAGSPLGDFDEYDRSLFDEEGRFDAYGRHRLDDEYGRPLFRDPLDEDFK